MKKLAFVVSLLLLNLYAIRVAYNYKQMTYRYLRTMLPVDASKMLLKYTEKYRLDWLKTLGLLYGESQGKQYAQSHKYCKGYMQLHPRTSGIIRKRIESQLTNTDIYDTEYNIYAGCLFLRTLLDNFAGGDYNYAYELYNVGWGNWRKGRRSSSHVKKCTVYATFFEYEYREFFWKNLW